MKIYIRMETDEGIIKTIQEVIVDDIIIKLIDKKDIPKFLANEVTPYFEAMMELYYERNRV